MEEFIRTPEEFAVLQNKWSEALDDGVPCASYVTDVLEWVTNEDMPMPLPPQE